MGCTVASASFRIRHFVLQVWAFNKGAGNGTKNIYDMDIHKMYKLFIHRMK